MESILDEKVSFGITIRAKPERVYDAITTAEGLNNWFTTAASVDARPGGEIRFYWEGWGPDRYTGENGGPVLEADRPDKFVFQWKSDDNSFTTTVEINFEKVREGTAVRLVEYGYEDSPQGVKNLIDRASGWGQALTLLKFFVEYGLKY